MSSGEWRGHVICGGGLKGDLNGSRIILGGGQNLGQWQETLFARVWIELTVACFSFKLVTRLQQPMTSKGFQPSWVASAWQHR